MLEQKSFDFEGMNTAYWEGGSGQPLLLIHGSGPGASTLGNWRLVLDDLAKQFHVIAPDLIGFGKSARKPKAPFFDLDLWSRQIAATLALFEEREVNVLGHSLSGYLALRLASNNARVRKVMTTGAMGARFALNKHLVSTWSFPATREAIVAAASSLVYDKSVITEAFIQGRVDVLHRDNYGSYFEEVFQGDKQQYIDAAVLTDNELSGVRCPTLLVHGRNDMPIPFEEAALPLARALPHADLYAVAKCGHSPALEHPALVVKLAGLFF